MKRRAFIITTLSALVAACRAPAAAGVKPGGLGICSFSCHRAWQAVRDKSAPVPFADGPTFYHYARKLGADGADFILAE
jgi:hypothetical protein